MVSLFSFNTLWTEGFSTDILAVTLPDTLRAHMLNKNKDGAYYEQTLSDALPVHQDYHLGELFE